MTNEQKERLEQELRFLNESLEADVISRDEYERGKERIDRKLNEIVPVETKEAEEEPGIEIKEIKEHTKIIGAEEKESPDVDLSEAEMPEEKQDIAPTQEEDPDEISRDSEIEEPEEEIEISKKWFYIVGIIIIVFILFFAIRSCKSPETDEGGQIGEVLSEETHEEEFVPECSRDSDCKKEGSIAVCANPGAKEAKCEFTLDQTTDLIVINDKDCKLCSTANTITIVKEIFPNAKIREIDLSGKEAQALTNELGIDALPAYIFDSNVQGTANFKDFTALRQKGDSYLITDTASGAVYYLKRPLVKNKLDLYVLPETDGDVESNVQEVLTLFNGKLDFTKHVITEKEKKGLEAELAINTYPTFLVNNQVKFRGILPADTIKEKICSVNYFEECKKELSKI